MALVLPISLNNNSYDIFPEYDDDEILEMENEIAPCITNRLLCCETTMYKSTKHMGYMCEMCGKIEEFVGNEIDVIMETTNKSVSSGTINNYNTSSASAVPIRMVGVGSHFYERKLISNTSNYKKTQRKNTTDEMLNFIFQYEGPKPPKNVVLAAAELYHKVQQHLIKRAKVKRGAMGACLSRMCDKYGTPRKPKEIASIFDVPQSAVSTGEKLLDELEAEGKIKINKLQGKITRTYRMESFIDRYFESLGIPIKWKEFTVQLIRFSIKYRIAKSSIMSSKCAGVIYVLSLRLKELKVTREMISMECNISKSTFNRFHKAVSEMLNTSDPRKKRVRNRLRHLFDKHKINWRETA